MGESRIRASPILFDEVTRRALCSPRSTANLPPASEASVSLEKTSIDANLAARGRTRTQADLSLAFCTLLWGATFVVVKNALDHASVFLFLAVRFSLAAVLMAAFRPRVLRDLKREELLAGAALGLFMFGGYAFQTAGLQYTTPAKSGFVTGSSVVLVPLLLAIFWRRHLARWAYAGSFCAVVGLYFLTVPVEGLARLNRGDILTFVAA